MIFTVSLGIQASAHSAAHVGGRVPEAVALNDAVPYAPPVAILANVIPFMLPLDYPLRKAKTLLFAKVTGIVKHRRRLLAIHGREGYIPSDRLGISMSAAFRCLKDRCAKMQNKDGRSVILGESSLEAMQCKCPEMQYPPL